MSGLRVSLGTPEDQNDPAAIVAQLARQAELAGNLYAARVLASTASLLRAVVVPHRVV